MTANTAFGQLDSSQIISKILDHITQVEYYECQLTKNGKNGFKENDTPILEYEWKESSSGMFYGKRVSVRKSTQNKITTLTAFNGESFFYLSTDGLLTISKKLPDVIDILNTEDYLTNPFAFLIPTHKMTSRIYPNLQRLKKLQENLKDSKIQFIQKSSITLDGRICAVGEIEAGEDTWTGKEIIYRFYCDQALNYYPVAWDKLTKDGKLMTQYRITSIGTQSLLPGNSKIYYSQKASTTYFDLKDGRQTFSYETIITSLNLFKNECQDLDVFMIDPSLEKNIYDEDNQAIIRVPH
jgi:hypothetical protein